MTELTDKMTTQQLVDYLNENEEHPGVEWYALGPGKVTWKTLPGAFSVKVKHVKESETRK